MLNMTDTETLDRSMNLRPCLAVIWNLQVSLILKMIAGFQQSLIQQQGLQSMADTKGDEKGTDFLHLARRLPSAVSQIQLCH